jgi:osmotically-inducible protein OsmY
MAQPSALLILPAEEQTDGIQAMAQLLMQSREDLRLAERVNHALRTTGYVPLRDIAVTVQARLVMLEGQVPSYFLKQLAQASAMAVPGVQRVRNDLKVGRTS